MGREESELGRSELGSREVGRSEVGRREDLLLAARGGPRWVRGSREPEAPLPRQVCGVPVAEKQ